MRTGARLVAAVVVALVLGGCGQSSQPSASGPAPQRDRNAPEKTEESGAPSAAECAQFREYGVGNNYCEAVEEEEAAQGLHEAMREAARERRGSPSGKSKWEELAE